MTLGVADNADGADANVGPVNCMTVLSPGYWPLHVYRATVRPDDGRCRRDFAPRCAL